MLKDSLRISFALYFHLNSDASVVQTVVVVSQCHRTHQHNPAAVACSRAHFTQCTVRTHQTTKEAQTVYVINVNWKNWIKLRFC